MPYDEDTNTFWEDNDDIDEYIDEHDDEPLAERPLKEWKKKELRAEVKQLRQLLDTEIANHAKSYVARRKMRTYLVVNQRHHDHIKTMVSEAFDKQGWRVTDMQMVTENPPPVTTTSLHSVYNEYTSTGVPRGTITLHLIQNPSMPEGI